jgi:hypothetical protein
MSDAVSTPDKYDLLWKALVGAVEAARDNWNDGKADRPAAACAGAVDCLR